LAVSPVFDAKGEVDDLYFVDLDAKVVYASSELGHGHGPAEISSRLGFDAFPAKEKGRRRSVEVPEAEKVAEARQRSVELPKAEEVLPVQQVQKKGRSLRL
jgi:hypothetical protein